MLDPLSIPNLFIPRKKTLDPAVIKLAASKSISNRALIINALCEGDAELHNLSEARDTRIMKALLSDPSEILDAQDAGTTMRFLAAYLALSGQKKVLTGTARMQQRPIGILVDALCQLGCEIEYLSQHGYPPLSIRGFKQQKSSKITIQGNISSQYISAILMMAPTLPLGLDITIEGKLMSKPYVNMTLDLMSHFGASYVWDKNIITIPHQKYQANSFTVESDWSAASYWYGIVALSERGEVDLLGLNDLSSQGDRQIVDLMSPLGVNSQFNDLGVRLTKGEPQVRHLDYDFSTCPDLAQTVLCVCAGMGVTCKARGLESLRIKETDRIAALQNELAKIGATLLEESGIWSLIPPKKLEIEETITFKTYEDHRMAMALAPLALRFPVIIEDPQVVQKSYPGFWSDLALVGLVSS